MTNMSLTQIKYLIKNSENLHTNLKITTFVISKLQLPCGRKSNLGNYNIYYKYLNLFCNKGKE